MIFAVMQKGETMIHHWIIDDDLVKPTEPEEALKDFHRCSKIDVCEHCKAFANIGMSNVTYCDILREHNAWLENRICAAIDAANDPIN